MGKFIEYEIIKFNDAVFGTEEFHKTIASDTVWMARPAPENPTENTLLLVVSDNQRGMMRIDEVVVNEAYPTANTDLGLVWVETNRIGSDFRDEYVISINPKFVRNVRAVNGNTVLDLIKPVKDGALEYIEVSSSEATVSDLNEYLTDPTEQAVYEFPVEEPGEGEGEPGEGEPGEGEPGEGEPGEPGEG
jgi:hypothetical protein